MTYTGNQTKTIRIAAIRVLVRRDIFALDGNAAEGYQSRRERSDQ
jgi:hypothetical protein